MNDQFVTLAIRTYPRAVMIKTVLEEEGIETVIHNLNKENPEMAVGVRVRIRESDLPRALKIVEDMESAWEQEKMANTGKKVLIPIDFSDMVPKTIDFGFYLADHLSAEIIFLYVYFSPAFTISMNNDVNTYSISDSDLLRRIISTANADVDNMKTLIKLRINQGELPDIPFHFELKEGVPEDQIIEYCKKIKPDMVVMGTHGKKISHELIGSVTAEVIESCDSPVLAVPMQTALSAAHEVRKVAFLTNFDQKDLIAIDKTIQTFSNKELEMYFLHVSEKQVVWDEIMLTGIKAYFANHYPGLKTHYAMIESHDSPEKINDYLMDKSIDVLAFNTRRRKLFARIFQPGLVYKMLLHSDAPVFVTHV